VEGFGNSQNKVNVKLGDNTRSTAAAETLLWIPDIAAHITQNFFYINFREPQLSFQFVYKCSNISSIVSSVTSNKFCKLSVVDI